VESRSRVRGLSIWGRDQVSTVCAHNQPVSYSRKEHFLLRLMIAKEVPDLSTKWSLS
jgi:hypothetical protein